MATTEHGASSGLSPLCLPRHSLLPSWSPQVQHHTAARSTWGQRFAWLGRGERCSSHGKPSSCSADLCPPCLRANQRAYTCLVWSPAFLMLSICPNSPPASKGGLSPPGRTPGMGCPVCNLTQYEGLPIKIPFSLSFLLRVTGPDLIAFLSFLPNYTCFFLTALVIKEFFYQFPVSFQ